MRISLHTIVLATVLTPSIAAAQPGCEIRFEHRQVPRDLALMAMLEVNGAGWPEILGLSHSDGLELWTVDGGGPPSVVSLAPEFDDLGAFLLAADLDGDLDRDAAYYDVPRASLVVLENTGGALSESTITPCPDGLAATLDYDRDGDTDIAVAHAEGVLIMLNDGAGGFSPGPEVQIAGAKKLIAAASNNADTRPDLIVVAQPNDALTYQLIQEADGSLTALDPIEALTTLAADADGDGLTDIFAGPDLLRSLGTGAYLAPERVDQSIDRLIAAADLDGDGDTDLIGNHDDGDGAFSLLNDGNAAFVIGEEYIAHPNLSRPPRVEDFDGDDLPDLVSHHEERVNLRRGLGDGRFESVAQWVVFDDRSFGACRASTLHDLDADGDLDVVALGDFEAGPGVAIFYNDGHGGLGQQVLRPLDDGAAYERPIVDDFDGDGFPDIAVKAASGFHLLEGSADGQYASAHYIYLDQPAWRMHVPFSEDFNGDGLPDLVFIDWRDDLETWGVRTLINWGGWAWTELAFLPIANDRLLVLEDLDLDGHSDLLVLEISAPSNLAICRGNGDGTFAGPVDVEMPGYITPAYAHTADLNGDGAPDLILQREASGFEVLLNDGAGTFEFRPGPDDYSGVRGVGVADLNGDGFDDLAVGDGRGTWWADVLLSDGDGGFQARVPFGPAGISVTFAHLADMNGDGTPDLVVGSHVARERSRYHGAVGVIPGECAAGCPADCNADGVLDTRDFICFLDLWSEQDPAADCDANGSIDTRDFICFLAAWSGGC